MSATFARRQIVLAALALNAVRPLRGAWPGIPSFAFGWPVSELAPHLLALTAVDTVAELTVRKSPPSKTGLAAAAVSAGLLASAIADAHRVGVQLDEALCEGIGEDYLTTLDLPGPIDLKIPRGAITRPFKLNHRDVEVLRNVPYTEGGRRGNVDIYRPRGADLNDAPVLLQIHGGGWTIGNKEQQGLILMNRMAQQGWVCVAANYRLAPRHPFPAQIVDVKRAIAWVHENIKEYGGDASYVVITGGSAGGHLSALAALTPGLPDYQPGFENADTSVVGCVPFYGLYDMGGISGTRTSVDMRDRFLGPVVFRKNPARHLEDFVQASPLSHVGAHAPDFFVIHGRNDTLLPIAETRAFVDALREKSDATVTYAEVAGAQHAFDVFSSIRSQHAIGAVQRWLQWHRANHQSRTR